MPSNTKSIQRYVYLTPAEFLKKMTTNTYVFVTDLVLVFVTIVLLVAFWVVRQSHNKNITPADKNVAYVSVASSSVSVLLTFYLLIMYIRIFSISSSGMFWGLCVLFIVCATLFGLGIYSSLLQYCPDGKEWSEEAQQCVPKCPPNTYLNPLNLICVKGCRPGKSDCQDDAPCIANECCDLTKNQVTGDGKCCPNRNVFQKADQSTMCCDPEAVCGDACCTGLTVCGKDNQCVLKCNTLQCEADESCIVIDKFSPDASILEKSGIPYSSNDKYDYVCQKINDSCTNDQTSYIFPSIPTTEQSIFYAAKDLNQLKDGVNISEYIGKALDCDHVNDKDCVQELSTDFDDSHMGYFCGIKEPIRLYSDIYTDKSEGAGCSLQNCLNNVTSDYTKYIKPIVTQTGDSHKYICNYVVDPNGPQPINGERNEGYGYQIIQAMQDGSTVISKPGEKQLFPKNPTNKESKGLDEQTYPVVYQASCQDGFPDLATDICPFKNTENIQCTVDSDIGYINDTGPAKYCCQTVQGQTSHICAPYSDKCLTDVSGKIIVCDPTDPGCP